MARAMFAQQMKFALIKNARVKTDLEESNATLKLPAPMIALAMGNAFCQADVIVHMETAKEAVNV